MKQFTLLEPDLTLFGGEAAPDPAPVLSEAEARRKAYRDLIEGEYREEYLEDIRQLGKQKSEERLRKLLNRIRQENPTVKEAYPGFDLRKELEDRDFLELLGAGVPLKTAYELKHMEEIKAAAARDAARQMTARMRSRAARPAENGTESQSAVSVKRDVSKLSRAERADIARRVSRGETISY